MLSQEAWYNSGNDPKDYWNKSGVLAAGNTERVLLLLILIGILHLEQVLHIEEIFLPQEVVRKPNFISGNFLEEESILLVMNILN